MKNLSLFHKHIPPTNEGVRHTSQYTTCVSTSMFLQGNQAWADSTHFSEILRHVTLEHPGSMLLEKSLQCGQNDHGYKGHRPTWSCCKLPEKSSVLPTSIKISNRIWYYLIIIEFYCWICACTFPVRSGPSLPSTGLKFIFSTYFRILGMSQAASTVIATSPLSSIYLGNSLKELNVHTSRSKPESIRKVFVLWISLNKAMAFAVVSEKRGGIFWPTLTSLCCRVAGSFAYFRAATSRTPTWHLALSCSSFLHTYIINYYYIYSAWYPKASS